MNNLSWILYWADVLPQLSSALAIICFLLFVPVAVLFVIGFTDAGGEAEADSPIMARFRNLWWAVVLLPLLWLGSFFVPDDKNTYYAIAASEVGEEVLKTPEVGKARQALNNWLDRQMNPPQPQQGSPQ